MNEKYDENDLGLLRKELRESNLHIVGLTGSIGIQNCHRKLLYAGAGWNDLMRWCGLTTKDCNEGKQSKPYFSFSGKK